LVPTPCEFGTLARSPLALREDRVRRSGNETQGGGDNVTLDLNGYSLVGVTSNSLDGIRPSGDHESIIIRNGHIRGWGGKGIASSILEDFEPVFLRRCLCQDIIAQDNKGGGIDVVVGSVIRCLSRNNGEFGITLGIGLCVDSVSEWNQGAGILCGERTTVVHCISYNNTGVGISCGNRNTIIGCTISMNSGGGLDASATLIRDCTINYNTGYGVRITFQCMIEGCNIGNTTGPGVAGAQLGQDGKSRIVGNHFYDNTVGISLTNNPGNCIYQNTLRNDVNLDVGAGNSAPVSNDPAIAGPWHNIAL